MTLDARMFRQLVWRGAALPDLPGAACTRHPNLPWIPDEAGGRPTRAVMAAMRTICAACPELGPCRDYALSQPRTVGMWGGLTAAERERRRGWLR